MEHTILTIKSREVPEISHLEAIDSQALLEAVKSQLLAGKYDFIAQQPGNLLPIEGYKTPLENSEIVLHICLRENNDNGFGTENMNEYLHRYIESKTLRITQAVRHAHGKHCRIVANIDSQS